MEVWVEMCSESGAHRGSLKLSANKQKQNQGCAPSEVPRALDDACTKHLLLAREIVRAVCPATNSVDEYNIHSAGVATQLQALSNVNISPSDLFALVELASYKESRDKHLRKAYREIKNALRSDEPLSRHLVNKHMKDTIRAHLSDKDVKAS